MKRSITRYAAVVALTLIALAGCKTRENADTGGVSETIAPAEPQPAATGSEAMTQTVNIEDSRSEAEGAALNKPGTATVDTAATTTTATNTAATTTTPPPTATR